MSELTPAGAGQPSGGPDHDERFDPEARLGELTGSEHLARYLWASQVADGKDVLDAGCGLGYGSQILADAGGRVTGVDVAQDAVDECIRRVGNAAEFRVADVAWLPFAPGSYDLVVCFEVIEHVEDRDAVLDEFKRVLRPGGVAVVSSPNRGVYPAGNPHHVFEYTSEELLDALRGRFEHAAPYRQHPWLASLVEPAERSRSEQRTTKIRARSAVPLDAGAETYAIVVASDGDLPALAELVVLGDAFEVRWFHEKIDWQNQAEGKLQRIRRENAQLHERRRETEARLGLAGRRLLEAEAENARIPQLEHEIEALQAIKIERDSLAFERDSLAWRLQRADRVHADMKSSISWRLTAPLRVLARLLREQPSREQVRPGGTGTS